MVKKRSRIPRVSHRIYLVFFLCSVGLMVTGFSNDQFINKTDSLKQLLVLHAGNPKELSLIFAAYAETLTGECPDSAVSMAQHGLQIAKKASYVPGIIKNRIRLGALSVGLGNLPDGKAHYESAAAFISPETDTTDQIRIWLGLGYVCDLQSDNAKALDCYMKGLALAKSKNDEFRISEFYNNIAVIYYRTGYFGKALGYYEKASELFLHLNHRKYYANSLVNIGQVFKDLGNTDSAKAYYLRALPLQKQLNNFYGLTNLYINLGSLSFSKRDYPGALKFIQLADDAIDSLGNFFWGSRLSLQVETGIYFGKIYLKLGDYQKALGYFTRVRSDAGKATILSTETEAIDGLRETYEHMGRLDSALKYAKLRMKFYDSLTKLENRQQIAVLEFEYKYLSEQEKARMEMEKEELKDKRKELKFILISSVIFMVAMILFVLFIWQRGKIHGMKLLGTSLMQEKSNLEMDLSQKNKELTGKVLTLIEKSEFIGDLSQKFKKVVDGTEQPDMALIRGMFHELSHQNTKGFWDEFNMRFNEVYTNFYSRLTNEFPSLTPNEIKLCAFLRLNLSSKDISTITRKSEHSIRIARYRLRQKLRLSRDENLTIFLNRF